MTGADPILDLAIPAGRMIVQLSLMMLLPLTLGMALRAWRPAGVAAVGHPLRLLSLVGLACLVSLMLIDQHEGLPAAVRAALPTALPFCIITMTAGFIVGSLARLPSEDRFTLLIEFSTRNLGLVAIMGALIMGQVKLVLFATLVFLIELPLVLVLIAMRSRLAGDRNKTPA